jgi:transposase
VGSPWPQRRWAVEGAQGLRGGVAQGWLARVNRWWSQSSWPRARLLNSGHARKTDTLDAASVAAVSMRHPLLRQVLAEDHSVDLRLLSDRRDDLKEERTRTANRLHALCVTSSLAVRKWNVTVTHAAG